MNCPQCGATLPEGAQFCGNCGYQIMPVQSGYQRNYSQQIPDASVPGDALAMEQEPTVTQQAQPDYVASAGGFMQQNIPDATGGLAQNAAPRTEPAPAAAPAPSRVGNPFASLGRGRTWATVLLSFAVGFAAAFVANLIVIAVAALASRGMSGGSFDDILGDVADTVGTDESDLSLSPVSAFIMLMLIGMGGAGELRSTIDTGLIGTMTVNVSFNTGVLGLTGIFFALGIAFTVFALQRGRRTPLVWDGVLDSTLIGMLAGIAAIVLAASSVIDLSGDSVEASMSLVTTRTLLLPVLLALVAALAGYLLAEAQPERGTVITAYSAWKQHKRGWARTLVEFVEITALTFGVLTLLALIALPLLKRGGTAGTVVRLMTIGGILAFGTATAMVESIALLGSVSYGAEVNMTLLGGRQGISGEVSLLTGDVNEYVNVPSAALWALFAIMVVLIHYVAMREAARNQYDRAYAGWDTCWKAPLAMLVAALVFFLLFAGVSASAMGNIVSVRLRMGALAVPLAALAVFLVEVIARTYGWPLVNLFSGLWKIILPGTVAVDPMPEAQGAAEETADAVKAWREGQGA